MNIDDEIMALARAKREAQTVLNESKTVGDEMNSNGDIIAKTTGFILNNWISNPDNPTIQDMDSLGGAIWQTATGDIAYRFSVSGDIHTAPHTKASTVFSTKLNRSVAIFGGKEPSVRPQDLKLIEASEFLPFDKKEFTDSNKRNTFIPTKYMLLEAKNHNEPTTTLALIDHLVNGDKERAIWVINWIAGFFQTLKKSQVSLVLRGVQGVGKGVLFDKVIRPLFGDNQTIQINDKTLNTNFLGGIVEGRLFFNLDEISHNIASSKQIKNFIKALVTNDRITAEKKNINLDKETPIYGQVYITSNEPYVIEVEAHDRRFTIYQTGQTLKKVNFLGYGTADKLFAQLEKELIDFAQFLKAYKVDKVLFNQAQDTNEKQALVNATNDKFTLFANAIQNRDLAFFEDVGERSFQILESDFEKDRICKEDLADLFNACFGEPVSGKRLFDRLRVIHPNIYGNEPTKSNGNRYYRLPVIE